MYAVYMYVDMVFVMSSRICDNGYGHVSVTSRKTNRNPYEIKHTDVVFGFRFGFPTQYAAMHRSCREVLLSLSYCYIWIVFKHR